MFEVLTTVVIPFILVLSLLVLIHELGHYLTAKKMGIKVEEFGFGFPLTPAIFSIKRGETKFSFYPVLIGGFVKLYGEDEAGGGSLKKTKQPPLKDIKRAFYARPPWQKAVIVLAGVFMNFVLAVVIISYLFSVPGVPVPKGYAEVMGTLPNTPAAQLELKNGDKIISFNGKPIRAVAELREILAGNRDKQGTLSIERGGDRIDYKISPQKIVAENGKPFYGIGVELNDIEVKKYPWYQSPFYGTIEAFKFSWLILSGLGTMVFDLAAHGRPPEGAGGPVAVAQLTGEAVKRGLVPSLWFVAILSLNLAVINVLPIPALDGGRLLFILIEMVIGKKVNPKYETLAHAIGLAVLLALILFITLFDVLRIFSGQSILPKM